MSILSLKECPLYISCPVLTAIIISQKVNGANLVYSKGKPPLNLVKCLVVHVVKWQPVAFTGSNFCFFQVHWMTWGYLLHTKKENTVQIITIALICSESEDFWVRALQTAHASDSSFSRLIIGTQNGITLYIVTH